MLNDKEGILMGKRYSILVICAAHNLRRSFSVILKKAGYLVRGVANISDGMALQKKSKHDLVVLDMLEPDISAADFLSKISGGQAGTPVLLLTGSLLSDSEVKKMVQAGQDYLIEPVTPEIFLALVSQILREKKPTLDASEKSWNPDEITAPKHHTDPLSFAPYQLIPKINLS
jgi:DNA-binding NtrC family response regulator